MHNNINMFFQYTKRDSKSVYDVWKHFLCFYVTELKETEEKLVSRINSQINQLKKCNCVDIDRKLNSLYHCSIAFAYLTIYIFTICWNMFTYSIINWIDYFEYLLFYRPCTGTLPRYSLCLLHATFFLLRCTYWISRCFVFNSSKTLYC